MVLYSREVWSSSEISDWTSHYQIWTFCKHFSFSCPFFHFPYLIYRRQIISWLGTAAWWVQHFGCIYAISMWAAVLFVHFQLFCSYIDHPFFINIQHARQEVLDGRVTIYSLILFRFGQLMVNWDAWKRTGLRRAALLRGAVLRDSALFSLVWATKQKADFVIAYYRVKRNGRMRGKASPSPPEC